MPTIQNGDVFAFRIDMNYGLIQVIGKSNLCGYNVRVFCELLTDLNDFSIKGVVEQSEFYYVKDFYEHDLLAHFVHKTNYKVPSGITLPQYMRKSERKLNGKLFWYVFDIREGKVIKRYDSFHEELESLSPVDTWGIEYITKKWREKFTLKKWNDELENKWYSEYLRSNNLNEKNDKNSVFNADIWSFIEKWVKDRDFSRKLAHSIERLFAEFCQKLCRKKGKDVGEETKELVEALNELNGSCYFIGSDERDEVIELIYHILEYYQCSDNNDSIDRFRQW